MANHRKEHQNDKKARPELFPVVNSNQRCHKSNGIMKHKQRHPLQAIWRPLVTGKIMLRTLTPGQRLSEKHQTLGAPTLAAENRAKHFFSFQRTCPWHVALGTLYVAFDIGIWYLLLCVSTHERHLSQIMSMHHNTQISKQQLWCVRS